MDDRNQYDMHSSLPGGLDSLKELVLDFHDRNIKVLLPLNPWDHGTSSSGLADFQALIQLIQEVGADGFNGDTMDGVNASYWDEALLENPDYPIIIEPETMSEDDMNDLETNLWSWGYWDYQVSPTVSAYKALTGGRHLTHICERWTTDHTDGVQHAFFNGAGFESWENVWGIWNGITERHGSLINRAATILRAVGDLVQGGDPNFVPHLPVAPEKSGVYATQFRNDTHMVFLLVNRNEDADADPVELQLPCRFSQAAPAGARNYTKITSEGELGSNCYAGHGASDLESPAGSSGATGVSYQECAELCDATDECTAFVHGGDDNSCYRRSDVYQRLCDGSAEWDTYASADGGVEDLYFSDLYAGKVLDDVTCDLVTGTATVTTAIEAGGLAAFMISTQAQDAFTTQVLKDMAEMTQGKPLAALSGDWEPIPQTMAAAPPADKAVAERGETVTVNATDAYSFQVSSNVIEGDDLPTAIDVQYSWEEHPQRDHETTLAIPELEFDRYTVSNAEYKSFLDATGWTPKFDQNWLNDWDEGRLVPSGWEDKPVTWVSRDDAAAYCQAVGARLPTSYEWQYAAQGPEILRFPWGEHPNAANVPKFTTGRTMPPPDDRTAHPGAASPFGLEDLIGNVYQWTDQFEDEHTIRAVIRGGSRWRAQGEWGNDWYLPEPTDWPLSTHDTFLLMSDSMDRTAGIGFRCVSEAKQ